MNSKNLGFGGIGRNPPNQRGQRHGFTLRLEVDDETHLSTQTHEGIEEKLLKSWDKKSGQKYI
jgi:hypothetical protein